MKHLLLLLITIFALKANAQNDIINTDEIPTQRICTAAEHLHEMENASPEMKFIREQIEIQTQEYISNPANAKKRLVVTIPVVVHVVYNIGSQNISLAQINSQIATLNQDFRKLNIEVPTIPSGFASSAADCEIQFVLAQRSPSGDTTSGVTRTYTTTTSFTTNNNIKYTNLGGHDAWPRDQYLNIWVSKLSNGVLGYAQFPGGPAATDGVVISYRAFGNMGTVYAPYNKGRTATHEIGHWLNLYHIWGDDGGSCAGSDLVSDTPNQGSENYGAPIFPHMSCTGSVNGDMFMNYMDYTNDTCMKMFTSGQKLRMMSLFATNGARVSLLSSLGGYPPVNSVIATLPDPVNYNTTNITGEEATVTWSAVPNATSYNVRYKINSPTITNYTTLTTTSTSFTCTQLYSTTPYIFEVQAVGSGYNNSAFSATNFTTDVPLVYYKNAETTFNIYPIPANNDLNIDLFVANANQEININLYNALGQLVQTKNATTVEGQNSIQLNTNQLQEGMYLLEYKSGTERKIQKISIKH